MPDYQDAASQVSRRRGSLACRVLRKEEGTEKEEPLVCKTSMLESVLLTSVCPEPSSGLVPGTQQVVNEWKDGWTDQQRDEGINQGRGGGGWNLGSLGLAPNEAPRVALRCAEPALPVGSRAG